MSGTITASRTSALCLNALITRTHLGEKNAQFSHIQSWVYLALYVRAGKLLVGASQFHAPLLPDTTVCHIFTTA